MSDKVARDIVCGMHISISGCRSLEQPIGQQKYDITTDCRPGPCRNWGLVRAPVHGNCVAYAEMFSSY